jgi:hypothetical protein
MNVPAGHRPVSRVVDEELLILEVEQLRPVGLG